METLVSIQYNRMLTGQHDWKDKVCLTGNRPQSVPALSDD